MFECHLAGGIRTCLCLNATLQVAFKHRHLQGVHFWPCRRIRIIDNALIPPSDYLTLKKVSTSFIVVSENYTINCVCVFPCVLGAASSSDDEPLTSDEDLDCPNKDQPHLRFQITSDDGFSVDAESIEGEPADAC